MKRDRPALLFQSLLSLTIIVFAGLVGFVLLMSARLSQETKGPPEASPDLVVADRAEWNQFYDAIVGSKRTAEIAQPADAEPEKRAASDVVEVPAATGVPEDRAPSASIPPTATTTLPVAPESPPRELAVTTVAPPPQTAAPPDHPREDVSVAASNEPRREQEPQAAAPSVAASEKTSPALATAPVPPLEGNTEKSTPSTTPLPAARPVPMPRPKVAAPIQLVPSAARVRHAAPQPEREPERSRPSTSSRARVALPRQRSAPQSDGPQRIDPQQFGPPQQQSGAMSYASPNALPPGGPKFGPYFPYGSSPPTAQQLRAQQSRSPQPPPRQPAPSYNDPYGWR